MLFRSSLSSNSKQIFTKNSSEYVQFDEPDTVVAAIQEASLRGQIATTERLLQMEHQLTGLAQQQRRLGTASDLDVLSQRALEAQTADLARAAWSHFQQIEAAGGALAALRSGLIADAVAASRAALAAAIGDKSLRIIGVTDFPSAEAAPDAAPPTRPDRDPLALARLPGADDICPVLAAIRLEEMAQ